MRKFLLVLLSAVVLLAASCSSWMKDDAFYSDIENDVKIANAEQISVYVRYAMTRQGSTDPDGPATFKVEIPHEISATTEPEYGFVRWAAFSTDFLATGDNQNKNKDIYFIDDEDYNARLLPHEILEPTVEFDDPRSPTTKVTINEKRDDIFLVPIVAQRPAISLTIPAVGSSDVVRNMTVRINFTKPMDPASFKNEDGQYDKITITQGIISFSSEGDIEINSEDISERFETPVFSKNHKMITLKFKPEELSDGFASGASVNITISKDVKDSYGFTMADDQKVSFTVGSAMDTLAPRITQLTAGTNASNFHQIKGIYKDNGTWDEIRAYTKMASHVTNGTYPGSADAPTNDITNTYFDTFVQYRVTNKLFIRVFAEDLAGSGSHADQTGFENDVQIVGIRARSLYGADGAAPASYDYTPMRAVTYVKEGNLTTSITGSYSSLVHAINETIPGTDNDLAEDKGCLIEYDLSSMPDGLIEIQVAAVDTIQNNGFDEAAGGQYASTYGNGWASLFVVKDTTPPSSVNNLSHVAPELSGTQPADFDNYYNSSTYHNIVVKESPIHGIVEDGHARLTSGANGYGNLKWMFRAGTDLNWPASVSPSTSGWALVSATGGYPFSSFEPPTEQGLVSLSYALMDDLGNISTATALTSPNAILYDSVPPVLSAISLPETTNTNITSISFTATDVTSGIKSLDFTVTKAGVGNYATPLSGAQIWVDGVQMSTGYTISGTKLTFTNALVTAGSTIQIVNLKLADTAQDGTYTISVQPKDRALNLGTIQTASICRDATAPVIEKAVPIAGIKTAKTYSGTTLLDSVTYWADSTALVSGLAKLEVSFVDIDSGAKIFDFSGSGFTVTDATQVLNKDTLAEYPLAARDATANTLTLASPILTPANGSAVTVVITNLQLTTAATGNTLSLKINDKAGNISDNDTSTPSVKDPFTQYTLEGTTTNFTTFKYDSVAPAFNGALTLKDRTYDTDTAATKADENYTNEEYVDMLFSTTASASGLYKLTISDATFVTSTAGANNATKVQINVSGTYTDIPSSTYAITSPTTIEFKSGSDFALFNSATSFRIKNVLLPTGGVTNPAGVYAQSASITATSFGGNSLTITDSITIDKVAPVWGSSDTDTRAIYHTINSSYLYPRLVGSETKAYGLTGIDSDHPNDIYFYINNVNRTVKTTFNAAFRDQNLTAGSDSCLYIKKLNGTISSSSDIPTSNNILSTGKPTIYYTLDTTENDKATIEIFIKDPAGNQSTIKTVHLISDKAFASNDSTTNATQEAAIDNYMVLYKPSGAFIHRNTEVTNGETRYVIKGDAQYQIRVKLGGAAVTTGEEKIEGGDPSYPGTYSRKENTTTSSKIEYYALSNYDSTTPGTWHPYDKNFGTNYTDGILTSNADSEGTISINLPNSDCCPLALWLKDACGNTVKRNLRPATMANSDIRWEVDTAVGLSGYSGSDTTYSGSKTSMSDVTLYKNNITITTGSWSETCRFQTTDNTGAVGTEDEYSLKSRIIVWTPTTGAPERDAFYAQTLADGTTASAWYYYKQSDNSAGGFTLTNTIPKYSSTNYYKLFYIVEDRVGNYEIKQIKRNSSTNYLFLAPSPYNTSGVAYWLYDETRPTISDVTAATNINFIDNKNYYSNNSTVTYTVTDEGSGIQYGGTGTQLTYANFANRPTSEAITKTLTSAPVSGKITLSYDSVKDWAGNTIQADKDLIWNNSTTWVQKASTPEFSTSSSNYISILNGSNQSWGIDGQVNTQTSTSSVISYDITSRAYNSRIKISFKVSDTDLMGWLVTGTELTASQKAAFYDYTTRTTDSRGQFQTLTHTANSDTYTYEFIKKHNNAEDWSHPWHEKFTGATYFYPVNKAGLIGSKAVKVEFQQNLIPALSGDIVHYDTYVAPTASNPFPTTGKITTYGSGTSAINYTKTGAAIKFSTINSPSKCWIIYGAGSDSTFGTDDDVRQEFILSNYSNTDSDSATYAYKIPLDTSTIRNLSAGTALKLRLFTIKTGTDDIKEGSELKELVGPANNNKWTFDETAPAVTFTKADVKSSPADTGAIASYDISNDPTLYIQSGTAKINLRITASESEITTAATDIAHYQWKVGSADWTDIPSANSTLSGTSGVITFTAPEEKTLYQFRVIDYAGNISAEHNFSTSSTAHYNKVTLQHDEWAPEGTLGYTTNKGANSVDLQSASRGLDTDYTYVNGEGQTVTDPETRDIKYSPDNSNALSIDRIVLNLSAITTLNDKHDSIARAGIKEYQLIKDGETPVPIDATATSHVITLPNDTDVHTYVVKVVDNIGQERTLKTFRTQADNQAPALNDQLIKSAASDGTSNLENAVLYNSTYYLKNDKAVISFTIDDLNASYYWSNDNSTWSGTTADVTVTKSYPTVTYTFNAPDNPTHYYFKAVDRVGNPRTTSEITVQRDKWAPGEGQTTSYSIKKPNAVTQSTLDEVNLTAGLDTANGADETYRIIKYSSVSGTTNYATKLDIDFHNINDIVDGINRSGFAGIYLNDSSTPITLDANGHYQISLTSTLNNSIYKFTAKDNIGQERVLYTFKLTADNAAPALSLAATNPVKTFASTGTSDIHNVTAINNGTYDIYFMKKDKSQVTFSIDDTTATYMWKIGAGSWDAIPDANKSIDTTNNTITVTFGTPDEVTLYSFKAVDGVLNESSTDGIQLRFMKDYVAPTGTPTYRFLSGASVAASGTIHTETSGAIKYKTGTVTYLEIDLSPIADNAAGSGIKSYSLNGTELTATGNPSLNLTDPSLNNYMKISIELATSDAVTNTYTITAEDKVGNSSSALLTVNLISDASIPDFALASTAVTTDADGQVYHNTTTDTWYVNGTNAIVNFTMTATDTTRFEWDNGTGTYDTTNPITLTDMKYSFAAPTSSTTYKFRAIDNVGNASADKTVTIVQDTTAPAGSATYNLYNGDTETTSVANPTNGTIGDYLVSTSGTTTTITYNPTKVNKLIFTPSITDAGSGYDALYRHVEGTGDTVITDNAIALTSTMNAETYVLIAKDKAGNTLDLGTYVFTADGTGPVLDNSKVVVSESVNMAHGYTSTNSVSYVTVQQIGNKKKANLCTNETKIMYAKTLVPDAVKYQIVKTVTTNSNNGYNATAAANSWLAIEEEGENFVFTLPEVHAHHTRLALFFMDSLGNVSAPYYIGNNGGGENDYGIQWWLTSPELSTTNVGISEVTLLNDTTQSGWQGVTKDYLVSINMPKDAVIHSIALSPQPNGQNTGVVFATGPSSNIHDSIFFTGYTATNSVVTELKTACINLAESTEVGLQLKIYVWNNITQTQPKIIINGNIELTVFPEGGYTFNIINTGSSGSGEIAVTPGRGRSRNEDSSSRITQFFNAIQDFFTNAPETVDNTVSEKPAKKAKKVKKTKKAAKASVKVAEKAVENVTEKVAAPVTEAITEQPVVTIPEQTSEAPVTVIESAAPADSLAVKSVEPAVSAEAAEEKSSNTAVIVVMLAILSCCAGAWFTLARKKK